jgi:hypothetical protein
METNLIRKIAHKFEKAYTMEFDDVFAEATSAYLNGLRHFDPSRGTPESVYLWILMRHRLGRYCKKNIKVEATKNKFPSDSIADRSPGIEISILFKEELKINLSKQSWEVCEMILESPEKFCRTDSIYIIKKKLRRRGWDWPSIWKSIREIKFTLHQMAVE